MIIAYGAKVHHSVAPGTSSTLNDFVINNFQGIVSVLLWYGRKIIVALSAIGT